MSDIYLQIAETPTVVTLSAPVISGALSSTVTVANTVTVALDANSLSALENVTVTVGAAVSVSNFPATQTIAGTVTVGNPVTIGSAIDALNDYAFNYNEAWPIVYKNTHEGDPLPISGTVTVGNTVTITGTVTANPTGTQTIAGTVTANVDAGSLTTALNDFSASYSQAFPVLIDQTGIGNVPISGTVTVGNSVTIGSLPAISGTVTANVGNFSSSVTVAGAKVWLSGGLAGSTVTAMPVVLADVGTNGGTIFSYDGTNSALNVNLRNIGGITPIISGTVTVGAMPNGSLTTRFGSVTTANTAFATSAVTNANRKYLLVQNVTTGGNVITVGIGFTPTTTQGIQLTAGAGITFESSYIPTGAVYVLSSVTASNFTVLEA